MGPTWRRLEPRLRCLLGRHEFVTDILPADPGDGASGRPARLRLRCLWCQTVTPGWDQGWPAYRQTYAGGLTAKEQDAALAAVRNVTDFRLAKKRRRR